MDKQPESIEDIYLQQKLIEAAVALKYEIKDQETLNTLLFITKQSIPHVCQTVIKEYKNRT